MGEIGVRGFSCPESRLEINVSKLALLNEFP